MFPRRRYYDFILLKNQKTNLEEIQKFQNKHLRMLIRHAYKYVPFYHKIFNKNKINPDSIKTVGDLKKIPIINKQDFLKNSPSSIISKKINVDKCHYESTSGTTGQPFRFFINDKMSDLVGASFVRMFLNTGVKFSDKLVFFEERPRKKTFFERIGIWRHFWIPYEPNVEKMVIEIERINPNFIFGYPSIIHSILQEKKDKNLRISPTKICSAGEVLTDVFRKDFEIFFESEVYDVYGLAEAVNPVATECSCHNGLHMASDTSFIEFVDEDGESVGKNEDGRIILTNLFNYAMPFIRYDTGDVGSLIDFKCECGIKFPLMEHPKGRKQNSFIMPSGREINTITLENFLVNNCIEYDNARKSWEIQQYQLIQKRKNLIKIRFVKGINFSKNTINKIKMKLKNFFREDIQFDFEDVDEIKRSSSGKLSPIISELSSK